MLGDVYKIFVRILLNLDKHISACLGRDGPNWRVQNACTACCYKVRTILKSDSYLKLTPICV